MCTILPTTGKQKKASNSNLLNHQNLAKGKRKKKVFTLKKRKVFTTSNMPAKNKQKQKKNKKEKTH